MTITYERACSLLRCDFSTGDCYWRESRGRVRFGAKAGTSNKGYLRVSIDGELHMLHRIVWLLYYGEIPDIGLDHKNGNKTDNRISNLRLADKCENGQNRRKAHKNSKTGILGVSPFRGKFRVCIQARNESRTAVYDSLKEAKTAYLRMKHSLHPFGTI